MLIDLALGAAVLALLVWLGRGSAKSASSGAWRIAGGITALAAFVGAALLLMRGGWLKGLPLLALGIGFMLAARWRRPLPGPGRSPPRHASRMSPAEARAMLGVDEGAGPKEIEAAYKRLMMRAHPDQGGSSGLAAQLNAARDVLLK